MRSYVIAAIVLCVLVSCALAAPSDNRGAGRRGGLPQVTVIVDGVTIGVSTSAETVGDLLVSIGVSLDPLDRTHPSPPTRIEEGLRVEVTRVTCRTVVEEETMPSETVVLADPDHPSGFTKILAHGADGRVRRVWRVWEKDGVETTRGLLSETVLAQPKQTIVLRGVYDAPSRGGDWRRPLVMEATAYYPGPRSCGPYADGYTATGVRATKGVVAVDDRVIPMGTRLYIPGYGFAVAADRGSAIKGRRIDLCFDTYREAIQFGRRKLKVYVLD